MKNRRTKSQRTTAPRLRAQTQPNPDVTEHNKTSCRTSLRQQESLALKPIRRFSSQGRQTPLPECQLRQTVAIDKLKFQASEIVATPKRRLTTKIGRTKLCCTMPALRTRRLRFARRHINCVDQLTETAEAAAIRRKNQARQLPDFRLVFFLPKCAPLHDLSCPDQVRKFLV